MASELLRGLVPDAAARTVAAGTARIFGAWSSGSPVPDPSDRRCDGVADLAARRAHVRQPLLTDCMVARLTEDGEEADQEATDLQRSEMIYDGANAYIRVGGTWTGFFLVDPTGHDHPAWPG
jgi:hypothetical protein